MNTEYQDIEAIKEDLRKLMDSIPMQFQELGVGNQIEAFDNLKLRITDKKEFQCEIVFSNTICLSETTIEIIWCLTYAHQVFYNLFCKGTIPNGQVISLQDESWKIPKEMLTVATNALSNNENFNFSQDFHRNFHDDNDFGQTFKYALLFFISHELFHVKWKGRFDELLEEEDNCDIDAIKLILNSPSDNDYLTKTKGICLGLMVLNVYGIHTKNFDGKTHPYTYDRLIKNLELFFGKENDKIWGISVAIFALHMTEQGIQQPEKEFDNFFDCLIDYKDILQNLTK